MDGILMRGSYSKRTYPKRLVCIHCRIRISRGANKRDGYRYCKKCLALCFPAGR